MIKTIHGGTSNRDWRPADYGHYGPFFIHIELFLAGRTNNKKHIAFSHLSRVDLRVGRFLFVSFG
jgi:hypothetical protein